MYNGVKELQLEDEKLGAFYEGRLQVELLPNQYLLIKNKDGECIDKYRWDGTKLVKLKYRPIESQYLDKIKPLNIRQECFFDLLYSDIPVRVVSGIAGSGKSFLSTAWALQEIKDGKYNKLIIVRNNINVADVPDIGAVPGDIDDKLKAYCAFIGDIVSDYTFDMLLQRNQLEMAYLGTMRGRSLSNCVILCSEAQNLTTAHVKMLMTRVAKNAVIIFDFDLDQIDKKAFEKDNGMSSMIEALQGNRLFGMVELNTIERSEVARLAELIR